MHTFEQENHVLKLIQVGMTIIEKANNCYHLPHTVLHAVLVAFSSAAPALLQSYVELTSTSDPHYRYKPGICPAPVQNVLP